METTVRDQLYISVKVFSAVSFSMLLWLWYVSTMPAAWLYAYRATSGTALVRIENNRAVSVFKGTIILGMACLAAVVILDTVYTQSSSFEMQGRVLVASFSLQILYQLLFIGTFVLYCR